MKRFDFAVLVAWILVSLMLARLAFLRGGDFDVYYAAARVVIQGGNPYDYHQLTHELVSVTGTVSNPYYYAPWFTWALLPLSFLSYKIARSLWAAVNVLLWFSGLLNLAKIVDWPPVGWRRWGMYILVTFLFAWTTWAFEQVGVLIFLMLTIVLLSIKHSKWNTAGLCLALLLFKPNITVLPVVAIDVWLLLRGKWKPVVVMGMSLAIMTVISLAISPGWYSALTQPDKLNGLSYTLGSLGTIGLMRLNTTLLYWLAAYNVNGGVANAIYVAVIISGLIVMVLAIHRSDSIVKMTAVILLVNYAITPYALFYDYPPLVLPLFYANTIPLRRPLSIWGRTVLNGFVILNLFIGNTIPFRYWMVIALMLLLASSYFMLRAEAAHMGLQSIEEHLG